MAPTSPGVDRLAIINQDGSFDSPLVEQHILDVANGVLFGSPGTKMDGSNIVDGSLRDAQIAADAAISTDKLAETATHKVLTATERTKLTNIPSDATDVATVTAAMNTAITTVRGATVPGSLDTLDELAAAINDDAAFYVTVNAALGTKAPLNNAPLTGNPTAPTAAPGDADTTIANTAFVAAAITAALASVSAGGVVTYNSTTHAWPARPATSNAIMWISTKDSAATEPSDMAVGDSWIRHPDAIALT